MNILAEYAKLNAMEPEELKAVWARYFDNPPQSHCNRTYVINQIIYRL